MIINFEKYGYVAVDVDEKTQTVVDYVMTQNYLPVKERGLRLNEFYNFVK